MKITVEFDTWEEMEVFRTSGKRTRGKGQRDEEITVEEVTEKVAQANASMAAAQSPPQQFTPPVVATQGFPGANGASPPPVHPLVPAILARIDGAIASGQPADAIVNWFRQQIGPEAAQATLDQLKSTYIPRLTEMQLKQIAPQLGVTG